MLKDFLLEETILIGVITNEQREEKAKEYLSELAFLTTTAGGQVHKTFTQKLKMPNPKTFIGEGKVNEVKDYIIKNKIFISRLHVKGECAENNHESLKG